MTRTGGDAAFCHTGGGRTGTLVFPLHRERRRPTQVVYLRVQSSSSG